MSLKTLLLFVTVAVILILSLAATPEGELVSGVEPVETLQGIGTSTDPFRWDRSALGVDSSCEAYFWNGQTWVSKTVLELSSDSSTIGGTGSILNPFRIGKGGTKGLFCSLTAMSPVQIMYWDKTSNAWTNSKPLEVKAAPAEKKAATAAPPAGVTPSANSPLPAMKEPSQLARQIDEVWMKIRGSLGFTDPLKEIWHGEQWITSKSLYGPADLKTATIPARGAVQGVAANLEKQCLINNFGWYTQTDKLPETGVEQKGISVMAVSINGISHEVNSIMVNNLQRVIPIIEQSGYKVHNWHSCRVEDDNNDGYTDAPTCGSLHPACLAIDINPQENPYCPKVADHETWWGRTPTAEERDRCRRKEIVTDIPLEIIIAFEENGFYWGGRFGQSSGNPTPDAMHFEYVGKPEEQPKCCSRQYSALTYNYGSVVGSTSTLAGPVNKDAYDDIIKQVAAKFSSVSPGLIKALIEAESTFNPNAPGGGLMQVKSFDENYEAMLKQNTDLNSLKLLNDVNNPTANIYVGTYKFLKLKGYLTGCVDLGCQIAAYNVGHTPINAAAQLITSPGSTPSWNAVYAQLQSNSNILVQSSSKWTAESAQERIKNLGPYVNTIIAQV